MRLGFKEVNVTSPVAVPQEGWLVRLYLWLCERLYHELAWGYDLVSWAVSLGQWRQWQNGVWREVRGHVVMDLGCGTGAMIVAGVRRGLAMTGVDHSAAMLAVAQRRLTGEELESPLLRGDGRKLPLRDGAFDTVMATFPAGYILDGETLAEVRRVLAPGGRLVILGLWVQLHAGWLARLIPLFYGRPREEHLAAIRQKVEAVGFRARWLEQRHGYFTVGMLVADRNE